MNTGCGLASGRISSADRAVKYGTLALIPMSATPILRRIAALESWLEFIATASCRTEDNKLDTKPDAINRAVEDIAKFTGKAPRSMEAGPPGDRRNLDLLRPTASKILADWVIDDFFRSISQHLHVTITTIPYSVLDQRYRHPLRCATSAFRAIPGSAVRIIRSAISLRRIELARIIGISVSSLYYRRATPHQISGKRTRHVICQTAWP